MYSYPRTSKQNVESKIAKIFLFLAIASILEMKTLEWFPHWDICVGDKEIFWSSNLAGFFLFQLYSDIIDNTVQVLDVQHDLICIFVVKWLSQ